MFMVERNLQGLSMDRLGAAPGDARCMCLFEAPRAEHVKELNDTARLPYHTMVEVLDLTA